MADNDKTTRGRPTKYKPEFCEQGAKLCLKGFIDDEIADFFDVDVATLNRWKLKYPDFCASLKKAKLYSDDKVVQSLYNRALGYEFKETKEETGGETGSKTTITTKQLAGDVGAMCFWLKNRQPNEWRDRQEVKHEVTSSNIMPVPVADSIESWEESAQRQQNEILKKSVE